MEGKEVKNINLKEKLLNAIKKIEDGSVELLIQNSKIVQVNVSRWYPQDDTMSGIAALQGEEVEKLHSHPVNREKTFQQCINSLISRAETIEYGSITLRLNDRRITSTEINEKIRLV